MAVAAAAAAVAAGAAAAITSVRTERYSLGVCLWACDLRNLRCRYRQLRLRKVQNSDRIHVVADGSPIVCVGRWRVCKAPQSNVMTECMAEGEVSRSSSLAWTLRFSDSLVSQVGQATRNPAGRPDQ